MKILASTGLKRLKVLSYYTGDSGTYMSVMPGAEAMKFIKQCGDVAEDKGLKANSPLNAHVTVVYSKSSLSHAEQVTLLDNGFNAKHLFEATVTGFTHWGGHDDSGYIVMELDCPELTKYNTWLRQTFDLPVSFDEYKAHITIAEDAYVNGIDTAQQVVDALNWLDFPTTVTLTGLKVEDLKK